MAGEKLVFRVHAIKRMFERGISIEDVREVLRSADVVENYPNDAPYPSRLLLGWRGVRPIHVVCARNEKEGEDIIITVYEPDAKQWEPGFRRRKP